MVFRRCVTAALFGIATVTAREGLVPHTKYTFAEYEREFSRSYATPAERTQRAVHFQNNLDQILANNANPHTTWTAGVNELTDRSPAELKRMRGHRPSASKAREHLAANPPPTLPSIADLPRDVDWRKRANVVTPVKNQGDCGSCWAFAATETLESHLALNTQVLNELAVQELVSCMPNPSGCGGTGGCGGATSEVGFDWVKKNGMTDMWKYGYTSGLDGDSAACKLNRTTMPSFMTVDDYKLLPLNDGDALAAAVATVGPLAISVDAGTWHLYHHGVFNHCNQTHPEIDHAVVLNGYGFDKATNSSYWLVRNSWSPVFGEEGYIRILRHTEEDEPCGMDLSPEEGIGCKGDAPQKVCGVCGVIYHNSYPVGAKLGTPSFTPHAFMDQRAREQYV